jgi:hypothetical protein
VVNCPVCAGSSLPEDVSAVEKQGKKVILKGLVHAVVSPDEAHSAPFFDYFTVPLYPRTGRVKYLKFRTRDELDKCGFIRDAGISCEGCLHEADGKEIVFDVTKVEFL